MLSAVALTLALINLRIWLADYRRWEFLAVASSGIGAAIYAWLEVALLITTSTTEYIETVRWAHLPGAVAIVGSAWFVYLHLGSGRRWMFWSIVGARALGLLINFASPTNINFLELTSIRQVTVFGETLSAPVGIVNPWIIVNQIGFLLLIIFSADAGLMALRRGERIKAVAVAGGVVFFGIAVLTMTFIATRGIGSLNVPVMASPSILFIVVLMALELHYDIDRSGGLLRDLRLRDAELSDTVSQLRLSEDTASVGLWARDLNGEVLSTSAKWRELFGFERSEGVTFDDFLKRIYPEDREMVGKDISVDDSGYDREYRVSLPNGNLRWIGSHGRIGADESGRTILREASVDITKRRLAEKASHELSQKLMDAQEKERARLARELHDDLSQSLALLSIKLDVLAREQNTNGKAEAQFEELSEHLQRLSTDIHRISHELHPAKLNQLGLEAAIRGFCRETESARGLNITCLASNVPRALPNEISLCLYRIAQESLQNVAKHSGASNANVELLLEDQEIRLTVIDEGRGFDPEAAGHKDSLGLISMEERVRAVNGTLTISSAIGAGTKIEARVPVETDPR